MSLQEQLKNAFSEVERKFKVGDKVVVREYRHGEMDLPYIVEKVNNVSYDLKIDLSEEEIEMCQKIDEASYFWHEPSFECWEKRRKKNSPYTEEQIAYAEVVLYNKQLLNVEESRISFQK